jgi:hypothetical protein
VEVTDQFIEWWEDLAMDQQAALEARVELLAERVLRSAGRLLSGCTARDTTT